MQTGLCATCDRLHTQGRLTIQPIEEEPEKQDDLQMFEPLYKRTSAGGVQCWQVAVEAGIDGTATIVVTFGLVDGKPRVTRTNVKAGKNLGKKNATTPYEQAVSEARSKWNDKRDREYYGLTLDESDNKRIYAPMLAHKWQDDEGNITSYARNVNWDDKDNLWGQPKFDGNRCRVLREGSSLILRSRRGELIDTCDHLHDQLLYALPDPFVMDGELYSHGVPVWTIRGLIAKKQPGTEHLCFIGYDYVNQHERFKVRFEHLKQLLPKFGPHLQLARTVPILSVEALMAFQVECIENGYEGAMFRHGAEGYQPDERAAQLLKVKTYADTEFTIVGCHESTVGAYEGAAIFECTTPSGGKFDVTAPGPLEKKRWYFQNWQCFVGKMMTIKYQMMTTTDPPVPFQPIGKEILP